METSFGNHPVWKHVFIASVFLFFGVVWVSALYLGAALLYFFVCRPVVRVLRVGPEHKWFAPVKRSLIALAVSLVLAVLMQLTGVTGDLNGPGFLRDIALHTAILFPLWYIKLLLMGVPFRVLKWLKKRYQQRSYAQC